MYCFDDLKTIWCDRSWNIGVIDTYGRTDEDAGESIMRVLQSFNSQWCLKRVDLNKYDPKVNFELCDYTLARRTCGPQPLRATVRVIPLNSSCPPFFGFSTACARRIAPAQVPQIGFVLVNSLSGCRSPASLARRAIVVDSAACKKRVHQPDNMALASTWDDQAIAFREVVRGAY